VACFHAPASAAIIDRPLPILEGQTSPWQSLANESFVTFAFKVGYGGLTWNLDQQTVVRGATGELDAGMLDQTFVESGDFTLRWAGSDFFRDWRDGGWYTDGGWNMGQRGSTYDAPLAVAYKHDNGPWKGWKNEAGDQERYPNNEIYFNSLHPWSFRLDGVDAGKYDFWSVALHEIIHMLACDNHATDPGEVMYESIGAGVRKTMKDSDWQILRDAGYRIIPEPTSWVLMGAGLILMEFCRRRSRPTSGRRTLAR
jgi:hypothetical protein